MKKLIAFLFLLSCSLFYSCGDTGSNEREEDLETVEDRDFGGAGADPTNGTVVAEDTTLVTPAGTPGARIDPTDTVDGMESIKTEKEETRPADFDVE